MTIKEKLYKEYIINWNKVYHLTGNGLLNESEEYFNSHLFKQNAKKFTKDELKNSIETAKRRYEQEVEKLAIKTYYTTDEGKAKKESLENQIDTMLKDVETYKSSVSKEINDVIKEWLGESWGVNLFRGSMEIGVIKDVYSNGNFNFHFGRDFDVYFDNYTSQKGKFRFDMNYGTTGHFNPFEDDIHCEFVIGMGKFLSNKEKMEAMKNRLHDYVAELEKKSDKISELRDELENPYKKIG